MEVGSELTVEYNHILSLITLYHIHFPSIKQVHLLYTWQQRTPPALASPTLWSSRLFPIRAEILAVEHSPPSGLLLTV